jgi:hypothetical protein
VVFPADWHGLILTRSYSKGKAGESDRQQQSNLQIFENMAGTTRLELATSAVTVFGNCLKLCGTDGYQDRALEIQVTNIGP